MMKLQVYFCIYIYLLLWPFSHAFVGELKFIKKVLSLFPTLNNTNSGWECCDWIVKCQCCCFCKKLIALVCGSQSGRSHNHMGIVHHFSTIWNWPKWAQPLHPINTIMYYICDVWNLSFQWGLACLTHCGPVRPYGDINLGQLWLRWWLVAWRHKAITWININFMP